MKGASCEKGSTKRSHVSKDEDSSSTDGTESMLLTGAMEEKEELDAIALDVTNFFLQTRFPKDDAAKEKVMMKLKGILVDMLTECIDPEAYSKFVTHQNNKKISCASMLTPLCP